MFFGESIERVSTEFRGEVFARQVDRPKQRLNTEEAEERGHPEQLQNVSVRFELVDHRHAEIDISRRRSGQPSADPVVQL